MIQIAILGYGVVGSGILQVLEQNRIHIEKKAGQTIMVKRVLDKRELSGTPAEPLLTRDIETILADDDIQVVAEVMGGVDPAYDYVKRALLHGKHVCTSNKELVIKHGAELFALAMERELNFMFEASVGGGIPVVRPINLALTTDEIVGISGILNGTSNFMLTQMYHFGNSYEEALQEAQRLGYAEADPTADTGGYDASRKLAILLSLATGKQVAFEDIQTEGIGDIKPIDFAFAQSFGFSIKPMVSGRLLDNYRLEAISAPFLVHSGQPLSAVFGVFNGVMVQAKATGDVMFYGQGAGQLPTAGAVISDIVDVAKHLHRHITYAWSNDRATVLPASGYVNRRMIRISCEEGFEEEFNKTLQLSVGIVEEAPVMRINKYPNHLAWITPLETEPETLARLEKLKAILGFKAVERVLRVYEPVKSNAY